MSPSGSIVKKNGSIPFELYWQDINFFLDDSDYETLNDFVLLEPTTTVSTQSQTRKQESPEQSESMPAFVKRNQVDLVELNMVMNVMESGFGKLDEGWKESRYQFFQMM